MQAPIHSRRVPNAFEAVRPAGRTAPAAEPRRRGTGRPPAGAMTLDRNGRPCVPLAPRVIGSVAIEGREQAQASADKRHALRKGRI